MVRPITPPMLKLAYTKEIMAARSAAGTHLTAVAVTQGMTQADASPITRREHSMTARAQAAALLLLLPTPRPAAAVRAVADDQRAKPHSKTLQEAG